MRAGEGRNLHRVKQKKLPESVMCGDILPGGDFVAVGGAKGNVYLCDLK